MSGGRLAGRVAIVTGGAGQSGRGDPRDAQGQARQT
jgi:hypothetical protein